MQLETIIYKILRKFNIKTQIWESGVTKKEGYSVTEIIVLLITMILTGIKSTNSFCKSESKSKYSQMEKDSIYRLKNDERMPWRRMLYLIAKKFVSLMSKNAKGNVGEKNEKIDTLIIDDTINIHRGIKIENISYVHDHTDDVSKLGFKNLMIAYFNGCKTIPIDFSIHKEKELGNKKQKKQYKKESKKNSNGNKRRKECKKSKIEVAIEMIKRAVKNGFTAKYVLTDSWFSCKELIKTVREIRDGVMHFIGAIKKDSRKYMYNKLPVNAGQLLKILKTKYKMKRCRKLGVMYYEVKVYYEEVGEVKLYFCKMTGKSEIRLFMSTDIKLSFVQAMEIYGIRWEIEVMFKALKEHFHLGRCQSLDFDAHIASVAISLITYIIVAYAQSTEGYETMGNAFKQISLDILKRQIASEVWIIFESMIEAVIASISSKAVLDISQLQGSMEYQKMKADIEGTFIEKQLQMLNIA